MLGPLGRTSVVTGLLRSVSYFLSRYFVQPCSRAIRGIDNVVAGSLKNLRLGAHRKNFHEPTVRLLCEGVVNPPFAHSSVRCDTPLLRVFKNVLTGARSFASGEYHVSLTVVVASIASVPPEHLAVLS